MGTKLSDVIHLYLGAMCISENGIHYQLSPQHLPSNWKTCSNSHKPILRPLSDMTDKEERSEENHDQNSNRRFVWLLTQSFDLFGLIESGQAFDSTKINSGM